MLQIITARAAKRKETVEASTPAKKQKVEEPEGDGKETPAKKQKVEEPEGDGKETMDTAETKAKVVVSLINVGVSYYVYTSKQMFLGVCRNCPVSLPKCLVSSTPP